MLPKLARLRAEEVRVVLASGSPLRVGPYNGKYVPGRVPLGVAVIVSKKDAGTAVRRNAMRRAAYRDLAKQVLPANGMLALFVRPPQLKKSTQ